MPSTPVCVRAAFRATACSVCDRLVSVSLLQGARRRLDGVHPNHMRIARGAMWVGLFVIAAKLCVAFREVAIAWRYGISGTVDAYHLAITVTTWLPMMLSATAGVVLVPRLVALHRDPGAHRQFVGELNGAVALIGVAVSALTFFAARQAVALLGSGLDAGAQALTVSMSRQLAPIAFFTVTAGYLSSRLQARERFAYSGVEALPALIVALFVVAPFQWNTATALITGTVIGFLLQTMVLSQMTYAGDPPLGWFGLSRDSTEWLGLYRPLLVMFAGQVILTVSTPVDQAFASYFGEGGVATLGYANRIVSLIAGVGSVVVARALLPVLSGVAADGNHALGVAQTTRWSLVLLCVGLAAAVPGWLFAPFAVRTIFERGAFGAADTAIVTGVFRFGLLQLPFYFGSLALVQWFAAIGRFDVLLKAAVVAIVVKVTMNMLLTPQLGLSGLMAATACMYAVSLAMQLFVATRKS